MHHCFKIWPPRSGPGLWLQSPRNLPTLPQDRYAWENSDRDRLARNERRARGPRFYAPASLYLRQEAPVARCICTGDHVSRSSRSHHHTLPLRLEPYQAYCLEQTCDLHSVSSVTVQLFGPFFRTLLRLLLIPFKSVFSLPQRRL